MSRIDNKNNYYFGFLFFSFLISRLIFINFDLSGLWDVFHYQPVDEFYYNVPALNSYMFGNWEGNGITDVTNTTLLFGGYLHNLFSTVTIFYFGATLFSIRLASIIMAMCIFTTMFFILKRNVNNNFLIYSALLYLFFDANFFVASIISEWILSRALAILLAYYITLKLIKNKIENNSVIFVLGVITSFLVFFVYLTNVFMILAVFASVLFFKRTKLSVLYYLFGVSFGLLIFIVVNKIFFNTHILNEISFLLKGYGSRANTPLDGDWLNIAMSKLTGVFQGNFFRINYFMFLFSIFLFPLFIFFVYKKQDEKHVVLLFMIISFLIQCLFVNDYPERKTVVILPIVILMIIYTIEGLLEYKNKYVEADISNGTIIFMAFILFISLFCLNVSSKFYVSLQSQWVYIFITVMSFVSFVSFVLIKKIRTVDIKYVILVFLIIPNILGFYNNSIFETKYSDSFSAIEDYVGDGIMVGGFSFSFNSNNHHPSFVNIYRYAHDHESYLTDVCKTIVSFSDETIFYSVGIGELNPTFNDPRFEATEIESFYINEPDGNRVIRLYSIELLTPFCN